MGMCQRGSNTIKGCGDPWGKLAPRTQQEQTWTVPQGCAYRPHPPRSRLSPEDRGRQRKCEKRRFSNKDSLSSKDPVKNGQRLSVEVSSKEMNK